MGLSLAEDGPQVFEKEKRLRSLFLFSQAVFLRMELILNGLPRQARDRDAAAPQTNLAFRLVSFRFVLFQPGRSAPNASDG